MRVPVGVSEAEQARLYPNSGLEPSRRIPRSLLPLVLPTAANLTHARKLHVSHAVPLWDALILAAAIAASRAAARYRFRSSAVEDTNTIGTGDRGSTFFMESTVLRKSSIYESSPCT